jgi:hypothetical protein
MNTEMNGKTIYSIVFSGGNGEELRSSADVNLEFSATYHGSHDEFWVLQKQRIKGELVEVARHNAKHLETIVWTRTSFTPEHEGT